MTLATTRQAIRHLVDEKSAASAMLAYYAFHHEAARSQIVAWPPTGHAQGFVTVAQTGIDLFRPLLTMHLPLPDLSASAALLRQVLPPGAEAFAAVPAAYEPLIRALCDVRTEEPLLVYQLAAAQFEPFINVLVTRDDQDGTARFVVKQPIHGQQTVVAAASLNWLSPNFGEISVRTRPEYRQKGYGRSVVASLAHYLLEIGRVPLYVVNPQNTPSIQLAESLGFRDTGAREWMLELVMRPE